MDLAGFILELELHRLCGQPAKPRPTEERVAVGYRAPIEGKIRLQAMSASQERYAAHANAHAGMGVALRWLQTECGPAVANLGADGMGEPFLSQEHLQRLDRAGQFADEFERGTAAHPARRLQLRQHHGVRGRSGQQAVRRHAECLQSQIEGASRIIRPTQAQIGAGEKRAYVRIRHVDQKQQAQCRVGVAILERHQTRVDGREHLGCTGHRAEGAIDQANCARNGAFFQFEAHLVELAGEISGYAAQKTTIQRAERGGDHRDLAGQVRSSDDRTGFS